MRGTLILVAIALVALVLSPWLGDGLSADSAGFVLAQLRLPRVALGALVGLSLGLVGAVFQTLFENALATPSTVGTTAGASLGALVVIVLIPVPAVLGLPLVAVGAFVGAAAVTAVVAGLAATRRLAMADLLLFGIAISLGAGAISLGLQVRADASATFRAVRWSLGSLAVVGWEVPLLALLPVVVGSTVLLLQRRALEVVAAGAEQAAAQGVDLRTLRVVALGMGSLLVAVCVAAVGPLAFVGLLVPHAVRLGVGGAPRRLLPLSAVLGAGLLPLADGLARVVLPGQDLPVGVVTAALGAPALVTLLLVRSGRPR